jgi:hypothetical protein
MDKLLFKTMAVAMLVGSVLTARSKATTFFVDDDAAPGGNGMGWTLPDVPFRFLQDALMVAGDGDLIKVAQGVYHPDDKEGAIDSRIQTLSFVLKGGPIGFVLEGGYAGLGGADPDLRDPATFVSILSGDLNDDDDPALGLQQLNRAENSLSVVNGGTGTNDRTVLDGFTIRDGHGGVNGTSGSGSGGAGMIIPTLSSPTIVNCTFTRNWAAASGGGLRWRRG